MRRYLAGGHLVTQANPCILRSYVESRGEERDGAKEPRPFVLFSLVGSVYSDGYEVEMPLAAAHNAPG